MKTRLITVLAAMLVFTGVTHGQPAKHRYSGEWEVISNELLAELAKDRPKPKDKFQMETAGIGVDRTNGDVYLLANNIGICKSTDQGKTFSLVSGKAVTGRFETGWGLNIDPAGGRLMCFSIYGSCGYSGDGGKTWIQSKVNHLDYGAVDWSDTGQALLAIVHESGDKLVFSTDAGRAWKELGKGFAGAGLFDAKTLLSLKKGEGVVRSTDGGATWAKVSDEKIAAPVMVVFKGVGYWLGEKGLLTSKDQGATWSVGPALPKGASLGPMFGADESSMVVGAADGLHESTDGGKTWTPAVPLAPEIKVLKQGVYGTYGWDPKRNIFYASQMMKPAYRFVAKK